MSSLSLYFANGEAVVAVIVWLLDLQLPMQSVLSTTVVSSNSAHGEVCILYVIQHYVIKFVSAKKIMSTKDKMMNQGHTQVSYKYLCMYM
jgi:hypothetical protein